MSDATTDTSNGAEPTEQTEPEVVIITGMSGAGRTNVAKVLEDLDFFVIDNLPPTLLDKVVELAFGPGSSVERLALVADVRGREFFARLVDAIRELREDDANVRIVFLEADDDTLVRRFEATRRRHPAADDGGVLAGIRNERELLTELRGLADLILDTTDLNVHELRDRVIGSLGEPDTATLRIKVVSFGFKHGVPRDADLLFDVRFLPNPHYVPALAPLTGLDTPVSDFVLTAAGMDQFMPRLEDLLDFLLPAYARESKTNLVVGFGCTGGRHRSVAIAEAVARRYSGQGFDVSTAHHHIGYAHTPPPADGVPPP